MSARGTPRLRIMVDGRAILDTELWRLLDQQQRGQAFYVELIDNFGIKSALYDAADFSDSKKESPAPRSHYGTPGSW